MNVDPNTWTGTTAAYPTYAASTQEGEFAVIFDRSVSHGSIRNGKLVLDGPYTITPEIAGQLRIHPYTIPKGEYTLLNEAGYSYVIFTR
jgi:hypothetical protein